MTNPLESLIYVIRGQKVMIDRDLAIVYGISTKHLNFQTKRNRSRFPKDFMFRLNVQEKDELVTNCDRFKILKHSSTLPYAFTEHGALMAANVLKSQKAVQMSIYVIRAFVRMREALSINQTIEKRLMEIEKTLLGHDAALRDLYEKLRPLLLPKTEIPKRRIGFHENAGLTNAGRLPSLPRQR